MSMIIAIETIMLFIVSFAAIRLYQRMKGENERLQQQIKDMTVQQYIDNRPMH